MRKRAHDAVCDLGLLLPVPDREREGEAAQEEISSVGVEHKGDMSGSEAKAGDPIERMDNATCRTCKHRREHERERVREMGFINCALLKPWDWIPQESKCRFSPVRWEAK